jgi:hypothetical protein
MFVAAPEERPVPYPVAHMRGGIVTQAIGRTVDGAGCPADPGPNPRGGDALVAEGWPRRPRRVPGSAELDSAVSRSCTPPATGKANAPSRACAQPTSAELTQLNLPQESAGGAKPGKSRTNGMWNRLTQWVKEFQRVPGSIRSVFMRLLSFFAVRSIDASIPLPICVHLRSSVAPKRRHPPHPRGIASAPSPAGLTGWPARRRSERCRLWCPAGFAPGHSP